MRKLATVLVVALVLLAGCGGLSGSDTTTESPTESPTVTPTESPTSTATPTEEPTETTTEEREAVHPPDPDEDVLGWEDGYWYNETIAVDRSDGLNETELDRVVARAMARVEVVRQLEFEESVPVEVISREEYKANYTGDYNYTVADRLHQNVKWEAMLMVNETTDAIAVQEQNRGATVGGFYNPSEERIVIVSENTTAPKMNEITLSQELFHALQDQHFNLSRYNQSTQEWHNAIDGIVEGDGNLVDHLYEQRCEAEWECLMPESGPGSGGGDIHFGMYLVEFQPYSDGPPFVRGIYNEQGWEGVNEVYENPPQSTEQVIHPEKYPDDEPQLPEIDHSPSGDWQVLDTGEDSVDYAVFGEAGLSTMLFYPYYHSDRQEAPVIGQREFFNTTSSGELSSIDPISYENEYTSGWDGDKLVPYVKGEPSNESQTGYVWKTKWDSEEDAREFVDGYEQLLEYYGAENVEGDVWKISDGTEFNDAFWIHHEGDTVMIVNAPSQDELDDVYADAGS
ncbi:MAG: Hvo_1808 family surface protein [Halanaeroarchaeum sp.]